MPGLDSNTKLLLHCDGADEAQETTDASDSNHTITFVGTAQLDTAVKKWGTASLLLDGDSDYLSALDSADWDLIGSDSDDWTIDLQVKHDDHVDSENYFVQTESSSPENRWIFYHTHDTGFTFLAQTEGDVIIILSGGEITDTDWHHVALCKVGSEYGLYLDGTQTAHVSDASTDTFAGPLEIGCNGTTTGRGAFFDGHMDEIRIQHSNYFEAAPVVGLTDTITVPPSSYARDLSINVHDCTDLEDIMVGG